MAVKTFAPGARCAFRFLLVAFLGLLAGCASGPSPVAAPKLVVVLIVDGLPESQVAETRDKLGPDGLRRFLDRGAWFTKAHYGHGVTLTAPGHAVVLTGAYPHRTGIIANEWRDPMTGEREYCMADASATYIGHKTSKLGGTSPKNLRVETVGDVLKRMNPGSKVVAISGKDRGAILPAGKTGTAYMYQAQTGEFASSTFYMKEHPRWVTEFHARQPANRYFHAQWMGLRMGDGQDKPGPLFYGALLTSPFADELALDFARAGVAGERLGQRGPSDILAVSLSAHDYVSHEYGPESHLAQDHLLHLDRMLEAFFRDLDAAVGKDNYLAVLTADHGFMPSPEFSRLQGRDAGRLDSTQLLARLNAELGKRFGDGRWAMAMSAQGVLFDRTLLAARHLDRAVLEQEARRILLSQEGIAAVFTRSEIESAKEDGAGLFAQVRRSWFPERSPDLFIVLKPYWMYGVAGSSGSTHGSPYDYDTHVPILFYGPAWVNAARIDARVEVVDIAPTLARMLSIPAPSASEGKPLPLEAPRQ